MIDLEKKLLEVNPSLADKPGSNLFFKTIRHLFREKEINRFIAENQHLVGFAFLDKVLQHFNFTYQATAKSYDNIPAEGRVIIVANHPIGSLDGLALLKMVRSVRHDVKVVANELLSQIKPLESLLLPVEVMSGKAAFRVQLKSMIQVLENEQALIIFPAGEVSRVKPNGVRDGKWKTGFLKLARRTGSPVLPVFVNAKNSALFYSMSTIYKPLGTAMLVHEMFNKENKQLNIHVGKPIPVSELISSDLPDKRIAKLVKKQLYRLSGKNKLPLFNTIQTIVHPARRKALKTALYQAPLLGETDDGKKIFLYDYAADSPVIHEIGRLRELSFRSVEEGTGNSIDIDKYDSYYRHLVLWDDNDLEIVGAYRIGECAKIINDKGVAGLYSSTLFRFEEAFTDHLPEAIELGRSFVQPRYWGKRSLDYLWFGIGAYLRHNPNIKYLFGPLSLSQAYSRQPTELILSFYNLQFSAKQRMASAMKPFELTPQVLAIADEDFSGEYKTSFKRLNKKLKHYGVKVPTLYKQYSEICKPGGCQFIAFNIDAEFNYCIDSLILVDLEQMKEKRKKRYLGDISNENKNIEEKKTA
ncbi:lysophospholipid acyltransferase family protein [Cocleimonas flava]|uniref:L-ornithine N(alpha)-acyltransferase n=1 Tax=Cocleimonas flava TaxID=634765 RepID=A0A4R1F4P6_9GAMM|nr:lysophospholipid acyltransferase family protein [Cocleimonas flava]TCJ89276.1 putative hemolysin [Cocleimonas flava]